MSGSADKRSELETLLRAAKARVEAEVSPPRAGEIPERIGPYRIEGLLGEGGMGSVYVALHEELGRKVALKQIRAEYRFAGEARERFLREARAVSRLEHPGICRVYEFGEDDGVPYFAMELLHGRSLGELIQDALGDPDARCIDLGAGRSGRAAVHAAIALAAQVARALHFAHEQGLVHRDIKPANILVREDGSPVVLDFGVARDERAADFTLTATGQMIGTPLYVPPEQVESGGLRHDRHADVYSLAVTLYEMLTLTRAFDGATQHEIFENILRATPQRPRRLHDAIPRELETVLATAMDRDPARRYATAADFAADLERVLAREPILAKPLGAWLRLQRWVQRNPWAAGLVAVLTGAATLSTLLMINAQRANRRFNLLAYEPRLQKLLEVEPWELPARQENIATMQSWLDDRALPLLAELDGLRRVLTETRELAETYTPQQRKRDEQRLPRLRELIARERELELRRQGQADLPDETPNEPQGLSKRRKAFARVVGELEGIVTELRKKPDELRSYDFANDADRFVHDGLQRLIAQLENLEQRLVPRVREQIAWAKRVAAETIEGDKLASWQAAAAAIAKSDDMVAHRDYKGLRVAEQHGLVPLGMDPESKLWEFAHLRSGSRPKRLASGKLELADDHGLVFVLLPAARFAMGVAQEDAQRYYSDVDEHPRHDVELDAFFISKFEMTRSQWRALEWDAAPSRYRLGSQHGAHRVGPRNPVENVSWDDCRRVLRRHGLVIPTEAQWEYAARGGIDAPWYVGFNARKLQGHANLGDESNKRINPSWVKVSWLNDGHHIHAPVGTFAPNPFGLHDIHGNVAEWCRDWFRRHSYALPTLPGNGLRDFAKRMSDVRCVRGGAFDFSAQAARSFRRDGWGPKDRKASRGVRPARRIQVSR